MNKFTPYSPNEFESIENDYVVIDKSIISNNHELGVDAQTGNRISGEQEDVLGVGINYSVDSSLEIPVPKIVRADSGRAKLVDFSHSKIYRSIR